MSLPFALRCRLIRDSGLFARVVRTFVRTVFSWQRRQAKAMGLCNVHTGSVTFAQRFGSLLQLNPHAHSWLPDGVFVETEEGELRFVRCAGNMYRSRTTHRRRLVVERSEPRLA
ncbi:MAG: transposase [Deltaproteobacteria bacterium]|nr:transposase [Deltaproteobacteria bacterium]